MDFSGGFDWEAQNRQSALHGQQVLERASQSLANSHAIAIETEQIGTETLGELSEQRESLLRSRNRLQNMDEGLSKSQRILNSMGRNVLYNKLLLILIIILEVGILVGLCFYKFFPK